MKNYNLWIGEGYTSLHGGSFTQQIDTAGINWKESLLTPPKPALVPEVGVMYRWKADSGETVDALLLRTVDAEYVVREPTSTDFYDTYMPIPKWTPVAELKITFEEVNP